MNHVIRGCYGQFDISVPLVVIGAGAAGLIASLAAMTTAHRFNSRKRCKPKWVNCFILGLDPRIQYALASRIQGH